MIIKVNDNGTIKSAVLPTKTSEITNDSGFITSSDIPVTSVNGEVGDVVLTKNNLGLENVENKSSATIRSELTQSDVTTALGFTPYTQAEVDALINGLRLVKVASLTTSGTSTITMTFTGICRGLLLGIASNSARSFMYMLSCNATTNGVIDVVPAGSSITVDTSTNGKITITTNSSGICAVFLLTFEGAQNYTIT